MDFDRHTLEAALSQLGGLLEARGEHFAIVVIGGSALLLGGWANRTTVDVDVVALDTDGILTKARPLPAALAEAVEDVAATLGFPATWLNSGPTDLLDWGLPNGFVDRCEQRTYGALQVFLAGRLDLICTKLYAVVDQGPRGRHVDDLRALEPEPDELRFAAEWVRSQDPSEAVASLLVAALEMLGVPSDAVE